MKNKGSARRKVVAEYGPLQIVRDVLTLDGRKVEELTVVVDPEWLAADREVNLTLKGEYIHAGREVSEEMACPLAFVRRAQGRVSAREGDVVLYALSKVFDSELSALGKNTGMTHMPVLKVRQKENPAIGSENRRRLRRVRAAK